MSAPGPPNLVLQPFSSPNAIEYAWDAPSQPNGAIIAYKLVLSTGGSVVYTNSSIPADWYGYYVGPPEITLTNGITYSATLQAINANGEGQVANFLDFQPGTAPFLPPSTATAVVSGTNAALVSWAPPAQSLDATIFWYTILSRSTNPSDPVLSYTADGINTRSYYISGLNNASTYYFDINAVNCPGYSPTASTNTITFVSLFGPNNLNGLELWLDASDTSTLILSGCNVTQWNDKSGRSRNATRFSGANPVYNSNALRNGASNGAVFIAGANNSLRSIIPTFTFASSITIFGVLQRTGDNSFDAPYSRHSQTAGAAPLDIYDNTRMISGGGGSQTQLTSPLNFNSPGPSTLIHNINVTPTIGVEWSNAVNVLNTSGSYSYGDTTSNFIIGSRGDLVTGFTGNYGEIILYSSTLTNFSRLQMEGYLSWKWGLQSNLYLGHPFRYAAPTTQSTNFNPTMLNNLTLWLDAADSNAFSLSGSSVATWFDKSPYRNDVSQATAGSRPTRVAYGSNYAVNFDGTDDFLTTGKAISNFFANNSRSIFVVGLVRSIATNSASPWLNDAFLGDTGGYMGIYMRNTTPPTIADYNFDGVADIRSNVFSLSNLAMVNYTLGSGLIGLSFNGGTPSTIASGSTTVMTGLLDIGRQSGNNSYAFDGQIMDTIIYSQDLDLYSRQQVEGYLAWKWSFQTSLYLGHPFRYSVPIAQSNAFLPSMLSNLTLWLDAADSNAFTLSGSSVATWADKSSFANNTTQATAGSRPTRVAYGSSYAVDFNGTTNFLATSVGMSNIFGYNQRSIFAVGLVRSITYNNTGSTIFNNNGMFGDDNANVGLVFRNSASPTVAATNYTAGNVQSISETSFTLSNLTLFNYTFGNSNLGIRLNGGTATTTATTSTRVINNPVNIGRPYNSSTYCFNGQIMEMVTYNQDLGTTSRQQVEGYLAWKWGFQSSLPANHPYKNQAPYYP
jgi:hypothetical protein